MLAAAKRLPLAVGVLLIAGGCAEHRIGLNEFLALERAAAETKRPGPSDVEVDRYLGPYAVGQGDVLEIVIAGGDTLGSLSQLRARVDRGGEIDLPIVGKVQVAGKELEDVEDAICEAYAPAVFKEAVCHVALASVATTDVLVVGAVLQPGLVPLRRTERDMLHAVVGAGGATEMASGRATLHRVRGTGEAVTLDLTDPVELASALALDELADGDIVEVHAAQPNMVFVGGLVNRPGPQEYPVGAPVTVLQALAAAHGTRTDVYPKHATLVRRASDGQDFHVKLDLNRVAKGEDPNIELAAGDILWVPETFETKVQDFLNRNLFLRAGVSVTYNVTGLEYLNRQKQQSARFGGNTLQDTFDPLGFLTQNTLLNNLSAQPTP
jgi:protein involved in polysaccharide export with SLBB domain